MCVSRTSHAASSTCPVLCPVIFHPISDNLSGHLLPIVRYFVRLCYHFVRSSVSLLPSALSGRLLPSCQVLCPIRLSPTVRYFIRWPVAPVSGTLSGRLLPLCPVRPSPPRQSGTLSGHPSPLCPVFCPVICRPVVRYPNEGGVKQVQLTVMTLYGVV